MDAYVLASEYLGDSLSVNSLSEYVSHVLAGLCPNGIQPIITSLQDSLLGEYLAALYAREDMNESPDWETLTTVGSKLSWKPIVAGLDAKYAGYSTVDNPILTQD